MQAVILAAGRGTRMKSLTEGTAKPMLAVGGTTLIEHKLAILPDEVKEVVIVIGYQGEQIKARFGGAANGRPIKYAVQDTLDGTAGAVWKAKPFLSGRFLVLMGDDIYCREDMEKCIATPDWSVVVQKTDNMGMGGKMIINEQEHVTGIEEGDHRGQAGLMNTNLFLLDERFFAHPPVPKAAGSDEFGLPQTVLAISKQDNIPLTAIETNFWFQITSPEDLAAAEAAIRARSAG